MTSRGPYTVAADPGRLGAIAVLDKDGNFVTVFDMPTEDDALKMIQEGSYKLFQPCQAAIESVHPLPGQSCMASFSYGGNFILAKLLVKCYNIDPVMISPQAWKKHYGLKRDKDETKAHYKGRSVELARKLFPAAKDLLMLSKDGRAEALLIAKYVYDISQECQRHSKSKPGTDQNCSIKEGGKHE